MKVLEQTVKDEIFEFKEQVDKFLAGTLNEEKFKTIRLNLGIYSQRQPGFYMVRAKLAQGRLFDYQLERIADVAEQFGRGLAHLTTRHDIQIHWVELKDIISVLELYAQVGITTREACGNSVRNITACPLAGICKKELFDVSNIAHATTEHFLRNPISQNLPRKFKIAFSGCNEDCAYSRINDIGFVATINNGEPGFRVYVGGGLGGHPKSAFLLSDFIPYNQTILYADAVVRVFDRYGNRVNRNMARLKYVFEQKGVEELKQIIEKEFEVVKEIYGASILTETPLLNGVSDTTEQTKQSKQEQFRDPWYQHNVIKQKQQGYFSVIIQVPFGDITTQHLKDIAKLSRMYGAGEIRTTLDQNFIIPWIHQDKLEAINEDLKCDDLIFKTNTFLNIISCPGAKTCNLGIARSQGLAHAIQNELNTKFNQDLSDISIRVCGCPNSCAQHHIANIGFSGMARRIGERHAPFYQVYLGGAGNEGNFRFAKPFLKVPAKNIPALTAKIITLYNSTKKDKETFNEWIDRYGQEKLIEELLVFSYLPEYERSYEFYYDYGMDEPFTIKDIGKGECAGGVVDTIEIYLNRAETKAMDAGTFSVRGLFKNALEQAQSSFTYAIQSLLVMKGEDPETIKKDFKFYLDELYKEQIIDERIINLYSNLFNLNQIKNIKDLIKELRRAIHQIRKQAELFDNALLNKESLSNFKKVEVNMSKQILDLKGVKCPYNYVKAKLKLEELTSGEELEVYLDDGEPIANVPRSLENDGHIILAIEKIDDAHFKLLIKKS